MLFSYAFQRSRIGSKLIFGEFYIEARLEAFTIAVQTLIKLTNPE